MLAAALALPLAAVIVVLARGSDGGAPAGVGAAAGCGSALTPEERRRCYQDTLTAALAESPDPNPVLEEIVELAERDQDYLAGDCHNLMHEVGRRYGEQHQVTLGSLMAVLPRSNDAGCPAGFAHGLIMHVAPQIDPDDPDATAAVCQGEPTRYRRYSCVHGFGHAFMRYHLGELPEALELCLALGPQRAPDCAQGAYHDYWLAQAGVEGTRPEGGPRSPRRLCAVQPRSLVRPCWYRAFIDTRPAGFQTRRPGDLLRICAGTSGIQREGCLTAASVIGSPNPLRQLRVCAGLPPEDRSSCLRGVKVQNLQGLPERNFIRLISRCSWFSGATRRDCYEWFGKMISVVTDGRFERSGCPRLRTAEAQSGCRRGARRIEEALVTFS